MDRKAFYNSLSEDMKTKIKACKTEDEMMKVLAEAGIALDDELLDSVSGGAGLPLEGEKVTDECDCYKGNADGANPVC